MGVFQMTMQSKQVSVKGRREGVKKSKNFVYMECERPLATSIGQNIFLHLGQIYSINANCLLKNGLRIPNTHVLGLIYLLSRFQKHLSPLCLFHPTYLLETLE